MHARLLICNCTEVVLFSQYLLKRRIQISIGVVSVEWLKPYRDGPETRRPRASLHAQQSVTPLRAHQPFAGGLPGPTLPASGMPAEPHHLSHGRQLRSERSFSNADHFSAASNWMMGSRNKSFGNLVSMFTSPVGPVNQLCGST